MPNTPPDFNPEEIKLLILESPPMDVPVEKIPEPVVTPKSAEPPEPPVPPVKPIKRKPTGLLKKQDSAPKPVLDAPVPKEQPDSDTLSNPLKMAEEPQPSSPPVTEDASEGSTPVAIASVHSVRTNADAHGPAVESSVGAMGGPQFIQRFIPKYPRIAQRLGVEGSVLLRLAIDASGKLTGVEVVTGAGNGFDEEAIQAVKRSTFAPAVQNGLPVRCLALLKIRFQLSNE
jgi:protein TonB